MHRIRLILPLLVAATGCAPALRPLPPMAPLPEPPAESPMPSDLRPASGDPSPDPDPDIAALRDRGLMVPVEGIAPSQVPDWYDAPRDGGRHHDALDILARRGTPVLAATGGEVLRVGKNTLGGNVIWATDTDRRWVFYYAHLERFANGLHEGEQVSRGEVIGYVGTTGNAPKNTPHLHFQLMRMVDGKRWWDGPPLDPLPFLTLPGTTR